MTVTESLKQEIDAGREGKMQGYSMGMPKLESIIDGVTKRTMAVLGGATGSGRKSIFQILFVYLKMLIFVQLNFKIIQYE